MSDEQQQEQQDQQQEQQDQQQEQQGQQQEPQQLPDDHPLVKTLTAQKQQIADLKARAGKVAGLEQKVTELQNEISAAPQAVATSLRAHLIETHQIDQATADDLITATDPDGVIKQVKSLVDLTGRQSAQAPFAGSSAATPSPGEDARFAADLFGSGEQ